MLAEVVARFEFLQHDIASGDIVGFTSILYNQVSLAVLANSRPAEGVVQGGAEVGGD